MTNNHYDIVIAGGGPVGSLCALLLASSGLRIAIIDRLSVDQALHPPDEGRTTAVSWGSSQLLEAAGLWSCLLPFATPIQEIRISQSQRTGYLHFNQQDAGHHPMGFIVDNKILRQTFYQALKQSQTIEIFFNQSIEKIETHDFHLDAILNRDHCLQTKLLIIAEGRLSSTREKLGFKTYSYDHQQTAIVTTVTHEQPHHHLAFEHFLPTGPLAFLPIGTHQSSVVWSLKNRWAEAMIPLSSQDFAEELERRFPYLGHIHQTTQRWTYPLHLSWTRQVTRPRALLIGDAAHALHPIAGQGANLGFRDAATLAKLIQETAQLGLDIGDDLLLKRYQNRRFLDSVSMMIMTEGLVKLFSQKFQGLAWLRGIGLSGVHRWPLLRQKLTHHAMGMTRSKNI